MEFGVASGTTLNGLRRLMNAYGVKETAYGFDSFKGLPENWEMVWDGRMCVHHEKGFFACELPQLEKEVTLVVGLFQDTLLNFLDTHPGRAAFVHIDSDLYSSAKYILSTLHDAGRILPGTVIQFDELYNSVLNIEHEWKALCEFLEESHLTCDFLGKTMNPGAAATILFT